MLGARNRHALTVEQIATRVLEWTALCGDDAVPLDLSEAAHSGTRTRFDENVGIVFLGANVLPGEGTDANSRMSALACLAHEFSHYERLKIGFARPYTLPDVLLDEAEASIAASFNPVITSRDRVDLVEDARDRLDHWLRIKNEE
jgi:hypothetical protein